MTKSRKAALALPLLITAVTLAGPGAARPWREEKCVRYRTAWSQALTKFGTRGLSPDFLASHDAFLASGCTTQGHVCPRSREEIDLANVMTIAAMNGGTASTFPPFACPK